MSRCFGSSSKLSAKEYIYKKRNFNMFCDLRKNFVSSGFRRTGTQNACVNDSGFIVKFNSHNDQLHIKNGFEQFLSINRPDLSKNYVGQQTKEHFCSPYGPNGIPNEDISNNYTYHGIQLTLATSGDTGQSFVIDSDGTYVNRYAEIKPIIAPTGQNPFPTGKKIIYENCGTNMPMRARDTIQIVIGSELPPPLINSVQIVIQ